MASSCRITILRLPDNYNRRTGLQTSVGGARMHCMHACVGELIVHKNNYYSYKERKTINSRKTKLMVETMTKTAQYVHDIELHFTEKKNDTNKKMKRFL